MILRTEEIAARLNPTAKDDKDDPLIITPLPDLKVLADSGSAAIDLRLGCWFSELKKTILPALHIHSNSHNIDDTYQQLSSERYIKFGGSYYLHPQSFVLAVTLEWVKIPVNLAAYIHGKSSWGRRGLVIATAAVIHPGFVGCITLELTNLGEVPIEIKPGMRIAQLCLHNTVSASVKKIDGSKFSGNRKPVIGSVKSDPIADNLMKNQRIIDGAFNRTQ